MGTETILVIVYEREDVERIVKLNNPLMGTETRRPSRPNVDGRPAR